MTTTEPDLFSDPLPQPVIQAAPAAPRPGPPQPNAFSTLHEARRWLLAERDVGVDCPCCGQFAKVYRRQVNASMARKIIGAYRAHGTDWFYLPTLLAELGVSGRDEGGLAYWNLIEEATERREDGGRAGWWRVTPAGRAYVLGEPIPRYALVYNGAVLGFEGEARTIHDALGHRFDYHELMGD